MRKYFSFGIVAITITIFITVVFRLVLQWLKFSAAFGKAITYESHEIPRPAAKPVYPNIWRIDFFEDFLGNLQQLFVLVVFCGCR